MDLINESFDFSKDAEAFSKRLWAKLQPRAVRALTEDELDAVAAAGDLSAAIKPPDDDCQA